MIRTTYLQRGDQAGSRDGRDEGGQEGGGLRERDDILGRQRKVCRDEHAINHVHDAIGSVEVGTDHRGGVDRDLAAGDLDSKGGTAIDGRDGLAIVQLAGVVRSTGDVVLQ